MSHWEQWGDDDLLLNMKKEAVMVNHLLPYSLPFTFGLISIFNSYFARLPMHRRGGEKEFGNKGEVGGYGFG